MLSKEWFSAAELATEALPGLPVTESGCKRAAAKQLWASPETEGRRWRKRAGRGGGVEYHYTVLPKDAFAVIVLRYAERGAVEKKPPESSHVFEDFMRSSDRQKERSQRAHAALQALDLHVPVLGLTAATQQVAKDFGVSENTIRAWRYKVAGVSRQNAVAALVPRHGGGAAKAPFDTEAWDFVLSLYLALNQPPLSACYRELKAEAAEKGWRIPSEDTVARRIEADVPVPVRVLMREGEDAMKRLYPAQERDRSMFHALEAVNADGHKWDLLVKWPDGSIGRPLMIAFQDLHSNLILSWRICKSENKEMVRLAFGDLVKTYGIPKHCWLDNGKAFASKWLTGGIPNRYRFKIKDEEPHGVLPLLGVQVHWTKPFSGQSKPIERAFGEFASNYARHPRFNGASVGNSPMAKPANHGEAPIPLDIFMEVAATCIHEHNNREGRRTKVCAGKLSFQQAFNLSYASAEIPKATPAHLQLLLLAAEGVRVKRDGSFDLEKTRYWSEDLLRYRGQPIVVRFDPQALHETVQAYSLDGQFIAEASLQGVARFDDVNAAREHAQAHNAWKKAQKEQAKALVRMDQAEAAALTRVVEEAQQPPPETKVIRLVQGNTVRHVSQPAAQPNREEETEDLIMRAAEIHHGRRLRLVEAAGDD